MKFVRAFSARLRLLDWLVLGTGALLGAVGTAIVFVHGPRDATTALVTCLFILLGGVSVLRVGSRPSLTVEAVGFLGLAAVVLAPFVREFLSSSSQLSAQPDFVSTVGAVAALVTLVLVQRQIVIARKQLALARREIALVREDLDFSREQSSFTKQQLRDLARLPRLSITFRDGESVRYLLAARGREAFAADMLVRNTGNRTARDAYVELLIPWNVLDHQVPEPQIVGHPETEIADGVICRRFGKQLTDPLYRGLARSITVFAESLILSPPSFSLRWRLRDDYDVYPGDNNWGTLEVRAPVARTAAPLQYQSRWHGDLFPMLAWDRTGGDSFVYASLIPDVSDEVVVIDAQLQTRIEEVVWSMPGLAGTKAETGQIGIEFYYGERVLGTARPTDPEEDPQAQFIRERSRHRCYVRSDGAVEVRLPQDETDLTYQVLRTVGAAYAIALSTHRLFGTQPRARGRFAYKFTGVTDATVGLENEQWIEIGLARDEFVDKVTPLLTALQRAGKSIPDPAKTKDVIAEFWAPYTSLISAGL